MNIFNQYPDILTFTKTKGGSSSYDDNGNLIIVPPTETKVNLVCRAEANLKGQYIIGNDGKQVYYAWYVLLKNPVGETVPFGTHVEVYRDGELRASGTVQRFVKDPLDGKIWL